MINHLTSSVSRPDWPVAGMPPDFNNDLKVIVVGVNRNVDQNGRCNKLQFSLTKRKEGKETAAAYS